MFVRDVLHASWQLDGDEVVFRIEADSFLRHMVRILVGTMLAVAGGRFDVGTFEELLSGADRSASGRPRRRTRSASSPFATDGRYACSAASAATATTITATPPICSRARRSSNQKYPAMAAMAANWDAVTAVMATLWRAPTT